MKKESLKQKAYNEIKSKIINCEYMPNSFLNESVLMEVTKSSRTPIREALSKLEQENFVTIIPKKGIMVNDLSLNDISMIFQVRELIEPFIILTNGFNLDKTELRSIRDMVIGDITKQNIKKTYDIDNRLHRFFIYSSSNKYFHQIMSHIYDQNSRMRILSAEKIDVRLKETQEEHLSIIDYIFAEKYDEAANAMKIHLANSKKAAIESLLI
ncbi:GntR family transcriptional regulator [Clostridium estertheticum]|uniref:GntR family transcriptional regulator n=1 Tax=Clostridium estertheticum TaxID=238834 RepID=UPI001C6EF094|nr:GntR family transcriptional regulator [Clostridium estertheticum]MBW9174038.1 GntR family transcriptional regulator [Clostridium estertheticum]WLC76598.1 GntR family transcriptional regulator [Clostridium estertheticum]